MSEQNPIQKLQRDRSEAEIAADVAKTQAETVKLEAEARKAAAEARKAAAEALEAEYDAESSALATRRIKEEDERRRAGDLYHHRYTFTGQVNASSVQKCIEELTIWTRLAEEPAQCPIEIVFNSPGGEVISGMALFDFIRTLSDRGHHVTTTTLGYAASMGGILLQAGDTRKMGTEAYILIHEISSAAMGKVGVLEDEVSICKKMCARVIRIFVDRSQGKLTPARMKKNWTRKDWWIDSDEALKLGLVDEII
jgi:ATP-dependent Clp protease protease subunit